MLNIITEYSEDQHDRVRGRIAKYIIKERMKILYSDTYKSGSNMVFDVIVKEPYFKKLFKRTEKYKNEIYMLPGVDHIIINRT